ncbi:oxidoreductase family protein [Colletotrichum tofieldiae]|uniref:Oxidoreductase family protein n=1 Tax=Colletotrichum tofieldiae TaxID=708197 RepID=A0A166SLM3_9PEZI|nr:oxidoreductase family protein [Colletotrichum tofieldiae]
MALIRLGIIGLSGKNLTSWASVAHLPYLLSSRGRAQYKIVALCNSSIESGLQAIEIFHLPRDARAYDSPVDLAQDASVDFVVCSTRVDKHFETIKPSIAAGKGVFVEWPLASNTSQVRELVCLAREQGVKSMVGLQGSTTAPIAAVRRLLKSGRIGKVLGSTVYATGGTSGRDVFPESLKYFTEMETGGNVITVAFGHLWEYITSTLGDVKEIHSRLQLLRPKVGLTSSKSGAIIDVVESNVPDLAFVTASLIGTDFVQDGASLLMSFRRGQPFPDDPHLTWMILGETGEIKLTAEGGTTPRTMASSPVRILWHEFATGQVQEVGWGWESWLQELPFAARGVAALYDAYAQENKKAYSDFEHALKRHNQLEQILGGWQESHVVEPPGEDS